MRALSLWEPWATLIMLGIKTWETRSWYTSYRGELLICAAKNGISKRTLRELLEYDKRLIPYAMQLPSEGV